MPANAKNALVRLLRWSEKYLKTDMVYLTAGGFWLVVGQIVASGAAFALALAFANLVPQEVYGTYKYVLSLAGIFAIFSLPGINTAVMRSTAQGGGATIHAATRARIRYSYLGSVCAAAGGAYYFFSGNLSLAYALLIIAATLPLFDTLTTNLSYLMGKRRFDLRSKYQGLTQIVGAAAVIATLVFTDNLLIILAAYFVPLLIVRAALYWHVARSIPDTAPPAEDTEVVRYGAHLTAMQILGMVANEIDKIVMWKFLGPVHVAVYTFALAVPEQIKGPLKGIGEVAFPKFAAQTPEQIRANLPALLRKLALYALGLFCISLLYILAAPYLFALVFPQYMASVPYSQWYALGIVTNIASIPIAILGAQKKTRTQYIASTIQPLIAIGLLVLLIPLYGITGAIAALLLSKFITLAIYLGTLFAIK